MCDAKNEAITFAERERTGQRMSSQAINLSREFVDSNRAYDPPIQVCQAGTRWVIDPNWRATLLGADAPKWFDLNHQAGAELVKQGDGRAVWRVVLENRAVFAKVADARGRIARLKGWLIGGAPQREWHILRAAYSRGVNVVRPLALGIADGPGRRIVLLSEGVEQAVHLRDQWRRDVQSTPGDRRRTAGADLIELTARCFASAHERGFLHADAHADNMLVHTESSGERQVVFVDAHGARLTSGAARLGQSLQSLAQLDQYFHRVATRTERLRFLETYFSHRPDFRGTWIHRADRRAWLSRLAAATSAHASGLARTRDRRLRRNGPYFSTFSVGEDWRITAALRLERRHVFPEEGVPDRDESAWRAVLSRAIVAWTQGLARSSSFDIDGLRFELKRVDGIGARMAATLLGPAERFRFETCHRQRHRDIRNDLLLGYGTRQRHGLVDATLLIRPQR